MRARVWGALLASLGLAAGARAQEPVQGPQDYALVDMERFAQVGELAVQRGQVTGARRFQVRANARYRLLKLDRATLRVGYVEFTSGRDGARFVIPPVPLRAQSAVHDADGDGLSDLGEFVLGSDPHDRDSDDDGVEDGAAAQAGTLGAPLLRTGLIASVQLPGDAQDVCAVDDMAAVALGTAGVALTNVYTRMNPEVVGLVDTPGDARRVACAGARLVVADGPAGLAIVDVSDPPAVRIAHQVGAVALGGEARCVATFADLALVGLSTGVLALVDLPSGAVLERAPVSAPGALVDVVVAGDAVYALDAGRLHALPLRTGQLAVAATVPSPYVAGPNARLFAGGGVVYAVHGRGANAFDVDDPLRPTLRRAANSLQFGWQQVALNGSGLLLAVVGVPSSGGAEDVELHDARDPAGGLVFLTRFETPGLARSVAIFNGLGYVADGARGLQVVNYVPQDRAGQAPTIALSTNQPEPTQCEEGALLRVSAACADDVAVRNCELWVDGVKVSTDGGFPFDFYLVAPPRSVRPRITVQGRVSDTGGRSAWSAPLVIELGPDATGPAVRRLVPEAGGFLGAAPAVAAFFSEPLDPATLTGATFSVTAAGPDGLLGTADDAPVGGALEWRPDALGAFFAPAGGALGAGRHRAALGTGITDVAGNPLAPVTWEFVVYDVSGPDADADGLSDTLELALGLDPLAADTDGDGLPDGQEDADLDGVANGLEVVLGFDPRSADSNGDGVGDAAEDRDLDLLPDWREVAAGTSLFAADTDGDGFTDADEVTFGVDPLDPGRTPISSWVTAVAVLDVASPERTLGRTVSAAAALNVAPPARTLGRDATWISVQDLVAPEAVLGRTQAPPVSVRDSQP